MVNYHRAVEALKAVENFGGLPRVAQLMTEPALRSTHHAWDADYDDDRYAQGRRLDPDGHYPNSYELLPDRTWPDGTYGPNVPGASADCDPAPYESFFFEQRESR